jgi:hypothetical protein
MLYHIQKDTMGSLATIFKSHSLCAYSLIYVRIILISVLSVLTELKLGHLEHHMFNSPLRMNTTQLLLSNLFF